jgi:hypothetical protein
MTQLVPVAEAALSPHALSVNYWRGCVFQVALSAKHVGLEVTLYACVRVELGSVIRRYTGYPA